MLRRASMMMDRYSILVFTLEPTYFCTGEKKAFYSSYEDIPHDVRHRADLIMDLATNKVYKNKWSKKHSGK